MTTTERRAELLAQHRQDPGRKDGTDEGIEELPPPGA